MQIYHFFQFYMLKQKLFRLRISIVMMTLLLFHYQQSLKNYKYNNNNCFCSITHQFIKFFFKFAARISIIFYYLCSKVFDIIKMIQTGIFMCIQSNFFCFQVTYNLSIKIYIINNQYKQSQKYTQNYSLKVNLENQLI
ncbi:transmembrane protein, putative (macronuclear) [Tetrahymena thermophila SB210]|uniref:Transmembrane protein, putative n=1 Tax=Tetrahymena thermophila (strain SB210) TaxID=312017 RepID=W7X8P0_TETTS|nr:transmembrane protein, putative [Tetrahymena thermophila SB210]EWS75735.1 transmembrane protein, putative [Tetrahymena thermophila SB210]|eukprot:XP_012651657.1 transmembrane protein, putative [Tetrahymena thermophila SB210]